MHTLLLIEDDQNLSESLSNYLRTEGFVVQVATTLSKARALLKTQKPHLVLLDWMLPDGQGIDLLREIERESPNTPVILVTARADLVDKVVGLESGANDYVTKPFEPRELGARIRVQLRLKSNGPTTEARGTLQFQGIILDPLSRQVTFHDEPASMTKMEFDLLNLLLENPTKVFPREALLNQVWGYDHFPTTRTVDNHVAQLRQKFGEDLIETVRGVGYRLRGLKK